MDNDSSDEDLLSPTFLSFPVACKNIATPEKISVPANYDLSPVTPLESEPKKKKHRSSKFSLMKLITEKSLKDEADQKLSNMDKELKAGIEQGGILNMVLHKPTDDAPDFNEVSASEDPQGEDLLPEHKEKLQKVNEEFLNDFPDDFPGESVFIHKPAAANFQAPVMLRDLLGIPNIEQNDASKFELDSVTREVLTCGFLIDMATLKDIDDTLLDWLLACICNSTDYEVIEGAFKAFWAIITLKKKAKRECKWKFSTTKFLNLLADMGASRDTLFGVGSLQEEFSSYLSDGMPNTTREKKNDIGSNSMFTLCMQTLLKCYTCCLKQFPQKYSKKDTACVVVVALRLCIDLDIIMASWEIQVLLGCAIDCYSESEWKQEAEQLCSRACYINKNHSNRLQMVEMIPITERGREFKTMLALKFISSECSYTDKGSTTSPVENVFKVVKSIDVNQATDFHHLFSTISLINYCLPEDSIAASDKKKLEKLISLLRAMNGEIRDPGGRFMNRTKVKDLIVRVISRLTYISRGLKTQSSLDGFFGEVKSNFDTLRFEAPQDKNCDEEVQEEEAEEQGTNPGNSNLSFESVSDEESEESIGASEDPLVDLGKKKDKEKRA